MELFKRLACANRDEAVMYFRDVKKNEVDIVLEMDNADLNSIEVKALSSVSKNSFRTLSVCYLVTGLANNVRTSISLLG
jgi:predicted AAA+ superfamily ATPase